jgi:hypothetical protein
MPEANAAPVGYGSEVLVWNESSGKLETRKEPYYPKYTPEGVAVLMGAHSLPVKEQQLLTWFLPPDSA